MFEVELLTLFIGSGVGNPAFAGVPSGEETVSDGGKPNGFRDGDQGAESDGEPFLLGWRIAVNLRFILNSKHYARQLVVEEIDRDSGLGSEEEGSKDNVEEAEGHLQTEKKLEHNHVRDGEWGSHW